MVIYIHSYIIQRWSLGQNDSWLWYVPVPNTSVSRTRHIARKQRTATKRLTRFSLSASLRTPVFKFRNLAMNEMILLEFCGGLPWKLISEYFDGWADAAFLPVSWLLWGPVSKSQLFTDKSATRKKIRGSFHPGFQNRRVAQNSSQFHPPTTQETDENWLKFLAQLKDIVSNENSEIHDKIVKKKISVH